MDIISYRFSKQIKLQKFRDILSNFQVYTSGNSFHGYGNILLSEHLWKEFTIGMLLLNYTRENLPTNIIVDTRWVAHRILSGFASLRWSNNAEGPKVLPQFYRHGILKL